MTVTLTHPSRSVDHQCGTCFKSPLWGLEFAVGSQIFGNLWTEF
jgi:hypothetical protein